MLTHDHPRRPLLFPLLWNGFLVVWVLFYIFMGHKSPVGLVAMPLFAIIPIIIGVQMLRIALTPGTTRVTATTGTLLIVDEAFPRKSNRATPIRQQWTRHRVERRVDEVNRVDSEQGSVIAFAEVPHVVFRGLNDDDVRRAVETLSAAVA